ncbi:hypothetical protein EPN96_06495 [bacterium]|nr:MAG: hypothetical protein EPN96_06495 [bacterium]
MTGRRGAKIFIKKGASMESFPARLLTLAALSLAAVSCVARHAMMEVPPPGGCDKCHRFAISNTWSATVAPGRIAGPPSDPVITKRYGEIVESLPVHARAPSAKLKIYIEGLPPSEAAEPESGVKCFVCHLGPNKEHESRKGTFSHPWGTREQP